MSMPFQHFDYVLYNLQLNCTLIQQCNLTLPKIYSDCALFCFNAIPATGEYLDCHNSLKYINHLNQILNYPIYFYHILHMCFLNDCMHLTASVFNAHQALFSY